jgi:hypothetical protein
MNSLFETLTRLCQILALGISAFVINVAFHELGHAIPKLFWTKKDVLVFIGSLGEPGRYLRLSFGRLKVYIKSNPFLWIRGLCRSEERIPVGKQIIVTAMGPLVSLVLTIVPFILLKTMAPDERQTVILVTFMVVAGMFTLSSGVPFGHLNPTHISGGVKNDATQILQLWKARNLPAVYWEAADKFRAEAYGEAGALLARTIEEGPVSGAIYRLALAAHFHAADYERAQALSERLRQNYRFGLDDGLTDGSIKLMLGRYREAVAIFRELLREHFNHFVLLNNMGYALIAAGDAEQSLRYLDRGLTLAPKFAGLYASRGWARVELGRWEEGLADAQQALKLDDAAAGAYRVLGLYAREKGDLPAAREYFLKARSIEPHMPFLGESLADVERRLQPQGEV